MNTHMTRSILNNRMLFLLSFPSRRPVYGIAHSSLNRLQKCKPIRCISSAALAL